MPAGDVHGDALDRYLGAGSVSVFGSSKDPTFRDGAHQRACAAPRCDVAAARDALLLTPLPAAFAISRISTSSSTGFLFAPHVIPRVSLIPRGAQVPTILVCRRRGSKGSDRTSRGAPSAICRGHVR